MYGYESKYKHKHTQPGRRSESAQSKLARQTRHCRISRRSDGSRQNPPSEYRTRAWCAMQRVARASLWEAGYVWRSNGEGCRCSRSSTARSRTTYAMRHTMCAWMTASLSAASNSARYRTLFGTLIRVHGAGTVTVVCLCRLAPTRKRNQVRQDA
jgi:hypothetical protein